MTDSVSDSQGAPCCIGIDRPSFRSTYCTHACNTAFASMHMLVSFSPMNQNVTRTDIPKHSATEACQMSCLCKSIAMRAWSLFFCSSCSWNARMTLSNLIQLHPRVPVFLPAHMLLTECFNTMIQGWEMFKWEWGDVSQSWKTGKLYFCTIF